MRKSAWIFESKVSDLESDPCPFLLKLLKLSYVVDYEILVLVCEPVELGGEHPGIIINGWMLFCEGVLDELIEGEGSRDLMFFPSLVVLTEDPGVGIPGYAEGESLFPLFLSHFFLEGAGRDMLFGSEG